MVFEGVIVCMELLHACTAMCTLPGRWAALTLAVFGRCWAAAQQPAACNCNPLTAVPLPPPLQGICSNFLCDAKPGQEITMTGEQQTQH